METKKTSEPVSESIAKIHSVRFDNPENPAAALIECSVSKGIGIHLVGIRDSVVKETLLRVVTALQSYGYEIPGKKIVINISPSNQKVSGSAYDLPIALSLIRASGQDCYDSGDHSGNLDDLLEPIGDWLAVGEIGLDGTLRPVACCEAAVRQAIASGCKGVVIPAVNAEEISKLFTKEDIPVFGAANLHEAITMIAGSDTYAPTVWDIQVGKRIPTITKTMYIFTGSLSVLQILEENDLREVITDGMTKEEALAAANGVIEKEFELEDGGWEYQLEVNIAKFNAPDEEKLNSFIDKFFDKFEEEKDFEQYDGSGDAQGYTTVSFTKENN